MGSQDKDHTDKDREIKEIKVTDKRMFTATGELREEYRFLGEKSTEPAAEAPAPAAPAADAGGFNPANPPNPPGTGVSAFDAVDTVEDTGDEDMDGYGPHLEIPGTPPGLGPTFFDLSAMLAEPAAIYMEEEAQHEGERAQNLEMARMHIDLLDVLRQKTLGNLTSQESAFLEDLLYRLRVRYVQKRG